MFQHLGVAVYLNVALLQKVMLFHGFCCSFDETKRTILIPERGLVDLDTAFLLNR